MTAVTLNEDVADGAAKSKKPIDKVDGVIPECYNTLIHDLFRLKLVYHSDYAPLRSQVIKQKDEVRSRYKKMLQKVDKKYKVAHDELVIKRAEEIMVIDTPYLERYYLARSFCSTDNKVNYTHLMRTFTLSSRLDFHCLDTLERVKNRKTPDRKPPKNNGDSVNNAGLNFSTPISRRTRASINKTPVSLSISSKRTNGSTPVINPKFVKMSVSDSQKRKEASKSPNKIAKSPKINKPNSKKSRRIINCERWVGDIAYCDFCNHELVLNINDDDGTFCFESHLLYACTAIPGLGPLPRNINSSYYYSRNRPRDIMRRLAEIGVPPDPGGQ